MSEELHDIFFYGLFMDEGVLREKGVQPQAARKAVVNGYRLKIGKRAMLSPQPSAQAFGMVYALTERETNSLYAEPGLDAYRPQTVVATFEDGSTSAVTTFNLQESGTDEEFNEEYAMKLRSVLGRLGFPITILLAAACFACVSMVQSSFCSTFSLEELVKRNQPNSGLNCSAGGGGGGGSGIGTGAGGLGGTQSSFHKGESFSCQISDAEQFDEAGFFQVLKASVEKDLKTNDAEITSSKNTDPKRFSIEYVIKSTSGRLEISGTRVARNYYSFDATLNEKSGDR